MRINFTFRVKILLSLIGTVFLLLAALVVGVRLETSRQIRVMTEQTKTRADIAFSELERLYHGELLRFARRISEKTRIPAALQEAVDEDDPQVLKEAAIYELNLAKIPLAVFTNDTGEPVITLFNLKEVNDGAPSRSDLQVETLLRSSTGSTSGYLVVNNHLFTTRGTVLRPFNRPVGTMTIGFPVDGALIQRMATVIQAELGFVVNGRLLAVSSTQHISSLKKHLLLAAVSNDPVSVKLNDQHYILISEPLLKSAPEYGRRIIAVSLRSYLDPLYRIERVFQVVGLMVAFIAVGLGISISRGLASPVKELVDATQKIGRGEYNTRVQLKRKDELSTLADSFNRMAQGLELKEQYRGILDKVVSPEVADEMVKGNITLGGENRQITTLFADVRGFASMTEDMEPQEVITMLNQYMEQAAAAVEAEGGVVDKYVGDEVMAIFGAPVSHDDDPLRAVRAAIKIQANIKQLNGQRAAANEPAIHVGIGINTGTAVAGNMGSVNRLNYTVLGESVNIAARLCSQAKPSEILISEFTYEKVSAHIDAEDRPILPMKGISKAVEVYNVSGFKRKTARAFNTLMMWLLFFTVMLGSGLLSAAAPPSPGIDYISPRGTFQVALSGRLHLEGYLPADEPAYLIYETNAFASGRLSLFADVFLGKRIYGLIELRADRGEIPSNDSLEVRIEQAFLRYSLLPSKTLQIQIGKFVSPFGDFSQRHDSAADPFIRPPLLHEHRTMICPGIAPGNNDGFINWKYRPEEFRPTGAPIIWAVPYQVGAMLFGSAGKINFRAAVMNSAPSSDPVQWDLDLKQSWNYSLVGHLGWHINPELTVGVSFNYGPYSLEEIEEDLEYEYGYGSSSINDYNQILWGFNVNYAKGRLALRAELMLDTWQVPNVIDDPKDISYYIEMMYKFLPGVYGAVRYNAIHFNKISYTDGSKAQWDFNVRRIQVGAGYRFNRKTEIKAEYMFNMMSGPVDPKDNLFAIQWIWKF